jgi:hypothetical protein
MKTISQPNVHICEICGNSSTDRKYIEKCEAKGKEVPLCEVGQKVWFIDEYPSANEMRMMDSEMRNIIYRFEAYGCYKGIQLEVVEIIKTPHFVEYLLGLNGCVMYAWSYDYVNNHKYPHIRGNKEFNEKCTILKSKEKN